MTTVQKLRKRGRLGIVSAQTPDTCPNPADRTTYDIIGVDEVYTTYIFSICDIRLRDGIVTAELQVQKDGTSVFLHDITHTLRVNGEVVDEIIDGPLPGDVIVDMSGPAQAGNTLEYEWYTESYTARPEAPDFHRVTLSATVPEDTGFSPADVTVTGCNVSKSGDGFDFSATVENAGDVDAEASVDWIIQGTIVEQAQGTVASGQSKQFTGRRQIAPLRDALGTGTMDVSANVSAHQA